MHCAHLHWTKLLETGSQERHFGVAHDSSFRFYKALGAGEPDVYDPGDRREPHTRDLQRRGATREGGYSMVSYTASLS